MKLPQLFLANTDDHSDLLGSIPFELPGDQRKKALAFARQNDRNNFIAARWILHEYFKRHAPEFNIAALRYKGSGKPFVAGDIHFSISHTQGLVGVLISNYPVGLDIERARDIGDPGDFHHVFTAEQMEEIRRTGTDSFFRLWTVKEAILKLTGDGLADEVYVRGISVVGEHTAVYKGQSYHFQSFVLDGKYPIAIACDPVNECCITNYQPVRMAGNVLAFCQPVSVVK